MHVNFAIHAKRHSCPFSQPAGGSVMTLTLTCPALPSFVRIALIQPMLGQNVQNVQNVKNKNGVRDGVME